MQDILFSTPHHIIGCLQDTDHPALMELLRRCPGWSDWFETIPPHLLGIWDPRGSLIGIVDAQNGPVPGEAIIHLLLIDPAHRRKRIGTEVYRAYADWVKRGGTRAITLTLTDPASCPFWEQLGFAVVDNGPDEQPGIVMRHALTPEILTTIFKRRSIRHYQDRPVEREVLVQLLEAAMSAPNACNSQPWEFIVITDQERLDRLREKLLFARYNGPAAIVVCGNTEIANNSVARHYWLQDCCAAAENILIAAAGMGLGAVWIGLYPLPSTIKPARQALNIPEHVTPICLLYVGYPAEERRPRTQYDAHRVHWQEYEPRKKRAKIKNAKLLD